MVKYSCERCGKEFSQKSHYDSHKRRKKPCENYADKMKQLVDKAVEDKFKELHYKSFIVDKKTTTISSKHSDLSYKLTKQICKDIKKKQGIYFTPPNTIQTNLQYLEPYMDTIKDVLEPSCGSCEYILALNNRYPHCNITGIEYNNTIFNSIKPFSNDNISIIQDDFLTYKNTLKYDLIIGNPPFFVMKKKGVHSSYYKYFNGRPNIFIIFILKSLEYLKDNGILSFILPKSFLNCLYYNKTRKYINDSCNIINIIECHDKYIETKQETIIFIIQKKKLTNEPFIIEINDFLIFGTPINITYLKSLYSGSKSLYELGYKVKVGTIVWNQCKTLLTDNHTKTRLIYSSDIVNKKLTIKKYANIKKKNYIDKKGISGPLLVINRGYGVGNYKFEYCLIDEDFEYLIENHLICINYTKSITNSELVKQYTQIIKSFNNKNTKKFIDLYFGNNAINTTEINYILPIYDS